MPATHSCAGVHMTPTQSPASVTTTTRVMPAMKLEMTVCDTTGASAWRPVTVIVTSPSSLEAGKSVRLWGHGPSMG